MRFLERVDPELRSALDAVPPMDLTDIEQARDERRVLAARVRGTWTPPGDVRIEDVLVPGWPGDPKVRVRTYRREGSEGTAPLFYWMHGGGHVIGDVEQDDAFLAGVVTETGATCVSVDWRHAPEDPFPAAVHDSYAGLQWAVAAADSLGVDLDRVVVGGASSGGGLAAGLALLVRDRGELTVHGQFLVYPMLDDRTATDPPFDLRHPRLWHVESNRLAWSAYLAGSTEVSPYAAPARAEGLGGLPPAWIATGELDLFADENVVYARRLMRAGVPTELHVYPGAYHGFDLFAPDAAVSRRMLAERDAALARFLGAADGPLATPSSRARPKG